MVHSTTTIAIYLLVAVGILLHGANCANLRSAQQLPITVDSNHQPVRRLLATQSLSTVRALLTDFVGTMSGLHQAAVAGYYGAAQDDDSSPNTNASPDPNTDMPSPPDDEPHHDDQLLLDPVLGNVGAIDINSPPPQDPPAQDPSVQDPPAEDPPAEDPPAQDPPVQDPPAQDPPAEDPPAQDPPAQDPPAEDPPAQDPPAQDPPAEDPPAQDPPAEDPTAPDPPAQDPPVQDPPAQDPPAEDPPAQDPPAQDPPVQDPPAQDPPAEDPPAQDPGSPPDSASIPAAKDDDVRILPTDDVYRNQSDVHPDNNGDENQPPQDGEEQADPSVPETTAPPANDAPPHDGGDATVPPPPPPADEANDDNNSDNNAPPAPAPEPAMDDPSQPQPPRGNFVNIAVHDGRNCSSPPAIRTTFGVGQCMSFLEPVSGALSVMYKSDLDLLTQVLYSDTDCKLVAIWKTVCVVDPVNTGSQVIELRMRDTFGPPPTGFGDGQFIAEYTSHENCVNNIPIQTAWFSAAHLFAVAPLQNETNVNASAAASSAANDDVNQLLPYTGPGNDQICVRTDVKDAQVNLNNVGRLADIFMNVRAVVYITVLTTTI
jgi:hypothetical protein